MAYFGISILINKNDLNWEEKHMDSKEEKRVNEECTIFLTIGLVTKCGEKYMLIRL